MLPQRNPPRAERAIPLGKNAYSYTFFGKTLIQKTSKVIYSARLIATTSRGA
jgi:hypothetical protein